MTTAESALRGFIEHPRRRLFVIILTSVVGLVTIWPVVDEYCVLTDECARTELSIAEAQQEIEAIAELRRVATGHSADVERLRGQMLVVEDVHKFSSKLVELTRAADCQLRRVDLGEVRKRKWYENDEPLKAQPPQSGAKETPYELRTQQVGLAISGPMDRVQGLLEELHTLKKCTHTQSIQLRPATDDRSQVNLELELLFFDLQRMKKTAS